MLFAVNRASGDLVAAGSFTTVYPSDYARTHLALDIGPTVSVRLHEEDGFWNQALYVGIVVSLGGIIPWSGNPGKNDTSFLSTLAAAQTAITMGAGTTYFFDTVHRRLCKPFAVNMAIGEVTAAAGGFMTVYPLDHARTHLRMLARQFSLPDCMKKTVTGPKGS